MKTILATIKGTTSLLQHRFGEKAEVAVQANTRRMKVEANTATPRDAAEQVSYQRDDGTFYFPGAAVGRLIREAGGGHKIKGSRKSAKYVVPAAVLVMDDTVTIADEDGKPVGDFEVDSRPVVIPATKGRVMRHRPRFDRWSAKVTIRVNDEILDPDFVHRLLVEGGQQIGLGDFRPEKGGPFGTFIVTEWSEK